MAHWPWTRLNELGVGAERMKEPRWYGPTVCARRSSPAHDRPNAETKAIVSWLLGASYRLHMRRLSRLQGAAQSRGRCPYRGESLSSAMNVARPLPPHRCPSPEAILRAMALAADLLDATIPRYQTPSTSSQAGYRKVRRTSQTCSRQDLAAADATGDAGAGVAARMPSLTSTSSSVPTNSGAPWPSTKAY